MRVYLDRGFLGNICPVLSCNTRFPLKINIQLNRRLVIGSSKASVIIRSFCSLKRKMPLMNIFRVVMGMAIRMCRCYLKHKKTEEIQINQRYIREQGQIFKLSAYETIRTNCLQTNNIVLAKDGSESNRTNTRFTMAKIGLLLKVLKTLAYISKRLFLAYLSSVLYMHDRIFNQGCSSEHPRVNVAMPLRIHLVDLNIVRIEAQLTNYLND